MGCGFSSDALQKIKIRKEQFLAERTGKTKSIENADVFICVLTRTPRAGER
jgi:hypothetical protein